MKRKSESKLQSDCFVYFNNNFSLKHHNPRLIMQLVPNESASSMAGVLKGMGVPDRVLQKAVSLVTQGMKLMGLKAGASDTIIIAPNRVVFVEFKLPNGTHQSNQLEYKQQVESLGHEYITIRSVDQFKGFCDTFNTK